MPDPRVRVLELLRAHGDASTGFQTLEDGFSYAFDEDDGGCVAYVDTGAALVCAGPPIGPLHRRAAIARRFVARARQLDRRVCFFGTDRAFAEQAELDVVPIGEEPFWDPAAWHATLGRSLREQLRRARAKRVTVRSLAVEELAPDHPTRKAVERLITRWLASRPLAAMGFLVDVRPFEFAEERVYAVAERAGVIIAFAAAVPIHATRGFLLEDLLRTGDAPNGTAELLVDHVFRELAARGVAHVTLGLAPLSGDVPPVLKWIAAWSRRFYNFDGVRAFKARLRPARWAPVYLALPRDASRALAVHDVLRAFATGGFVRFGLRSLHRQRRAVALVLGALLLPWVCVLALPGGTEWFPTPGIRMAWIVFNVALALALLGLFRRWSPLVATLLACVTAVDALLTFAQLIAWDLPRVDGGVAAIALATAAIAPCVATAFLWYSRRPLAA